MQKITNTKTKKNNSYILELDTFKNGIKNGLTSKQIIEEFNKKNINNPNTGKPYNEAAIRRLINENYGGYKNYILETMRRKEI
jgi:hypothetical protein